MRPSCGAGPRASKRFACPDRIRSARIGIHGGMTAALLLATAWMFEPGQALVSIEAGPKQARVSAVSLGLSGWLRELDGGALEAEVRLPLASFTTGSAARDARVRPGSDAAEHPEIVFQGAAAAQKDGALKLRGTLTLL